MNPYNNPYVITLTFRMMDTDIITMQDTEDKVIIITIKGIINHMVLDQDTIIMDREVMDIIIDQELMQMTVVHV